MQAQCGCQLRDGGTRRPAWQIRFGSSRASWSPRPGRISLSRNHPPAGGEAARQRGQNLDASSKHHAALREKTFPAGGYRGRRLPGGGMQRHGHQLDRQPAEPDRDHFRQAHRDNGPTAQPPTHSVTTSAPSSVAASPGASSATSLTWLGSARRACPGRPDRVDCPFGSPWRADRRAGGGRSRLTPKPGLAAAELS